MRIPVAQQREIARLHFHQPQSARSISRITGICANSVGELRKRIQTSGKNWPDIVDLDDDQWEEVLGTKNRSVAQRKVSPDWAWVHEQMQLEDATREQIWQEWREEHPDGIGQSQFNEGYRKWLGQQRVVMRQIYRPGDRMFADFAGRKVVIQGGPGEPAREANLFVAVMGCSSHTYLELVWQQTTACWLAAQANAFEYFGGVPNWVVSDNLKAAVLRREKDRIVLNPQYLECLKHYGTAPMPTKQRSPRQNAKAEAGVKLAQRWVLFRLRDRVFFSLEEANAEIRRLNELLNDRKLTKSEDTRRSRFLVLDAPALRPLPSARYELSEWRHSVRVGDDYLIEHGKCYYSVPWQHRGDVVDLRITGTSLEIFRRNKRLATHALLTEPGEMSRYEEHMPVAHRRVQEGEPHALLNWAKAQNPVIENLFTHHLMERHDLTNGLKAARKLRAWALEYGDERFLAACRYAQSCNITAIRSIESILKKKADLMAQQADASTHAGVREAHENNRGAAYFGGEA
jgi:transposase